jgi:CRP-like cAMP-binding protein
VTEQPAWPLLRILPEQEVRRVLSEARRRRFAKDEVVFHQGDPAATVHLVAKGRIAIRITTRAGDVATVELIVAGDLLGELALITPGAVRAGTAVALEPTETLSLDQEVLTRLRAEFPAVNDVLVQALAERIRRLDQRLIEALYIPADGRVFRRLVDLYDVYGEMIPLTQEDVAGLAGTTRATVNRVLRREEESGTLLLTRGRIRIVDPDRLARLAR